MSSNTRVDRPSDRGVLSELDARSANSFYWYLALLACIGGFLFGYDTAVIGSVLGFIPYEMSDFVTGYLVAGASIGAAVGALAAGPLTDRFGRKSLLVVDAVIYAVGALLSAVTISTAHAARVSHPDRPGGGRRLRHRDGVHRRVRAPDVGAAR